MKVKTAVIIGAIAVFALLVSFNNFIDMLLGKLILILGFDVPQRSLLIFFAGINEANVSISSAFFKDKDASGYRSAIKEILRKADYGIQQVLIYHALTNSPFTMSRDIPFSTWSGWAPW